MVARTKHTSVSAQLREMMRRSGLTSLDKVAKAARYSGASSIQRYFEEDFNEHLRFKTASKLADGLSSTGKVRREEVMALTGVQMAVVSSDLPTEADEEMAHITELDVRAAAGGGAMNDGEDARAGKWGFPANWLRYETRALPGDLRIITIEGNSMEPLLFTGDKAIVDTSKREPSPAGIFAVYDGIGLVAKLIEVVPNKEPITVKIGSANPAYTTYERTLGEVHIHGRVVGVWRRI